MKFHLIAFFNKMLWKEKFIYRSEKLPEMLRAEMETLFRQTSGFNFSVNLVGRFVSQDQFRVVPKWHFGIIKNFETDPAYLEGTLQQNQLGGTSIVFTVRPNSVHLILFILFPVFGGYQFYNDGDLLFTLFTMLLAPLFICITGYHSKQGIRRRFVTVFDLFKVE